ncbi:uncharacterized protein UV8b_05015 [Ustilaginoidea virens]|uniref:Phosphatidylinositol-specific phospholipase C X domain-containing protein n=1 Tax=Ustilaginoidea virens TaxID=1159556 RepID=A0A8E5HT83_USTVR|nr:uncharacterized protein UV8b_05015 [Ustilaginoidea virens]QUC20774.1 hypothetical protein UV8b_05015 [Ustilaginoidea virens]
MTTLLCLGLALALGPYVAGAACYKGYESAFSFDADQTRHAAWMKHLPDAANLTSLSIPGTHDTMTYGIRRADLQCQNWDLGVQLRAGLRYVDIRARMLRDELHVFHADQPTGHSLADVLLILFAFLDRHPSEAVVMRLKKEGGPVGRNRRSFQQGFDYVRLASPATRAGAAKHLYLYDGGDGDGASGAPIPTLGELRSKVFLLQDWSDRARRRTYGLRWDGPQMVLEDQWKVPDMGHLHRKWEAVEAALGRANADALDNRHLYLAHVSASVGVLPIEAAAGGRTVAARPEGLNDMTGRWVEGRWRGGLRTGIVIFDFPGKRAIEGVLRWNHHLEGYIGAGEGEVAWDAERL